MPPVCVVYFRLDNILFILYSVCNRTLGGALWPELMFF